MADPASRREAMHGLAPLPLPIVAIVDDAAKADSRDVAAFFEKRHDHVLRDIDGLLGTEPTLVDQHFTVGTYQAGAVPKSGECNADSSLGAGRSYRRFLMNRDGFSLLAMGFTGAKALGWKLRYIEAFNRMEAELRGRRPAQIDVRDPAQLAVIAGQLIAVNRELMARAETAEHAVALAAPKAAFYDRFADAEGLFGLQNAARALGQGPQAFIDDLKRDCLFHQGGSLVPRAQFANQGLFVVKPVLIGERARYQTFVTAKGLQWLAGRLRKPAEPLPAPGDLFAQAVRP